MLEIGFKTSFKRGLMWDSIDVCTERALGALM